MKRNERQKRSDHAYYRRHRRQRIAYVQAWRDRNLARRMAYERAYRQRPEFLQRARAQSILDVRGWGYLTGHGSQALGMGEDEAAKIQDAIGAHVADLMNRDAAQKGKE